ncbi:MAG TPA: hypothetical protein VFZ59_06365 [Verrucomicrobiae bacterium]|nr:hypothetical protein [Verrucomicrobiae bacterium]
MSNPPPLEAAPPPTQPIPSPTPESNSSRPTLASLLSLYLGLFLAEAIASLLNHLSAAVFKLNLFNIVSAPLAMLLVVTSIALYVLMAFVPAIPKRLFLPLALFIPLAMLVSMPLTIYFYGALQLIDCGVSLVQLGVGLAVLYWAQGGWGWRWPLIAENRFNSRRFSWRHLLGFVSVNIFVLLPGAAVYLFVCATVAVDHFSDGFVALKSHGLIVQARKYVRDDGKTIHLFPMAHVADRSFYRTLAESFATNSIALMEGVTDEQGLLTNHISYKRMAATLGVAEQQKEFNPTRGERVPADVDVSVFRPGTLGFLNLVMMVHSKGPRPDVVLQLMRYTPAPGFEQELLDDLLHKRNQHVIETLRSRLDDSEQFIVPWGAAHMPGIAQEIQKLGFRVAETRDFTVIHFSSKATAVEADQ